MNRFRFLVLLGTLILGLFPLAATAESVAGIKIQPTLIEQKVLPNAEASSVLRVTNLGTSADTFYFTVRDISSILPNGTPVFGTSTEITGLELSSWITVKEKSVTLKPKETKEIPFSIRVPADATPGAHVGGIVVATQPPELSQSGAAVSYGATVIVSLQVEGDVIDSIQVREFRTDKSVYSTPDVTFISRIENVGNTLNRPRGPIEIADMWGKKVSTVILNNEGAAILPHAVREFRVTWKDDGFAFGRYQVLMSVGYGNSGKNTITEYLSFWILPANVIVPVIVGFLLVILIGVITVRIQVRRKVSEMRRLAEARGKVAPPLMKANDAPSSLVLLYRLATTILLIALALLILVYFT